MRRRSSTPARATPSCSTDRSSTATSAMPRKTTSTLCSIRSFSGGRTKTPAETPAFFCDAVISGHAKREPGNLEIPGPVLRTVPEMTQSLRPRPAADIDHVAVAGAGVLVDEAGDQHASVEGDDLAILLAAGRAGRADIVLAALAALDPEFLRGGL